MTLASKIITKVGIAMIKAGVKQLIPEITKLINDPAVRDLIKDLELDKILGSSLDELTYKKKIQNFRY